MKLCVPIEANAGGLYNPIFGTTSAGVAGAGSGARASDASTAIHNPAGMTRLNDHQLMLTAAPGVGNTKFDADPDTPTGGGDGGQQAGIVPIVGASYVHKLSDQFRFGLALASLSGASLDPSSGWAGRNQLRSITLFTLSVTPSVAFRVTDQISIGAGAVLTYATLDWSFDAPLAGDPHVKIDDADDFAAAPVVSILYEPTSRLRFGAVYLGESDLELDGDVKLGTPMGLTAEFDLDLPLAQAVRLYAAWQASETISLFLSARWEDWGTLDTTAASINNGNFNVPLAFRDTWGGAIGAEVRGSDRWTFQTGLSYDSSPYKNSERLAFLPLDRIIRLGVGFLHDYSENTRLGFAFNYLNLGKAKLRQDVVAGQYDQNELFIFAFNVNWSKLPWSGRATF